MATIVKHIETGKQYILLGTGFGAYRATRPSLFFGNLAPAEDEGEVSVIFVCNSEGKVGWVQSEEVQVVEIDGAAPAQLL